MQEAIKDHLTKFIGTIVDVKVDDFALSWEYRLETENAVGGYVGGLYTGRIARGSIRVEGASPLSMTQWYNLLQPHGWFD